MEQNSHLVPNVLDIWLKKKKKGQVCLHQIWQHESHCQSQRVEAKPYQTEWNSSTLLGILYAHIYIYYSLLE